MLPDTRIAINTIAQYLRTIINVILGFYSTRLILIALGNEDYGIYMLVAGVVGMLSFLTNALSVTTQRFLSYEQGTKNVCRQTAIFANSLIIHSILGLFVFVVLEIIGIFLFDGFLNIPVNRLSAAKSVFHISLAMIFTSILTSPFRACLIAHENLVFTSIVEVADGIWKVLVAYFISSVHSDRLVVYALFTLGIYIFTFISFLLYTGIKYEECKFPQIKLLNLSLIRELSVFAGWSLYSSGCIIGRNQGTAIVLNKFFGAVVNASYGIAVQVSGALNFIASALLMAFNPPIAKAAGQMNIERVLKLSLTASKLSFLLMSMFGVPLLFRLSEILRLWLGQVPNDAVLLCSVIMVASIIDQTTSGLIAANRAIGKLKLYSLTVDTIKLTVIPALAILLYYGINIKYAIWSYAIAELLGTVTRLPVLKQNTNLNILRWIKEIYVRSLIPLIFLLAAYYAYSFISFNVLSFLSVTLIISILYMGFCYWIALNEIEQNKIKSLFNRFIKIHFFNV